MLRNARIYDTIRFNTPRGAGGIGLVSIDVAICTQNLKHAMKWLIQKRDRYFYAWAAWTFQDMEDSANWSISPGLLKTGRNSSSAAPQPEIRAAVSEWIAPKQEEWTIVKQHREESLKRLVTHLVATRSGRDLLLQYIEDIPTLTDTYTQEHKDFWATYRWDENPWVVDDKGTMLSTKKYPLLRACTLADLHIQRVSTLDYRIRLPRTEHNTYHTIPKLGLWATAILMASPSLHVDEVMRIPAQLTLRNGREVLNKYTWTYVRQGITHGCHQAHASGTLAVIVLQQANNGVHWSVDHMSGVPESEQQELVNLQQRTRNTEHGAGTRSASAATWVSLEPNTLHQQHARF